VTDTVFNLFADGSPPAVRARPSLAALNIVILLAISCALTNIKLGSLQLQDFLLLFLLWFSITSYAYSGFSLRVSPLVRPLLRSYGLFMLSLVIMALLAVRLTFFPLDQASFLKQPILFSLSKVLQFGAVICGFLWLTNAFVKHYNLLKLAVNTYWWTGIVSCLYAIACYAFLRLHGFETPEVFGAYNLDDYMRARGFFNEGGPFGVYIVSVFVVGVVRRSVTGRRLGVTWSTVLCIALVLSGSKAGFVAAALLILVWAFSGTSIRTRISYAVLTGALLVGVGMWLNFEAQLYGYLYSYLNIEDEIAARGGDYHVIAGRVSALHIVPKMITTHPLTGIGFGNYPLMRNDPDYLDGLPAVTEVEDLPGLGIPSVAAEIGLPATLWLIVLLLSPYWRSRKKDSIVAVAALFQPVAHIFSVQITFFYPWFVTACALGALFCFTPPPTERINS
jgi:hypothetical protein